MKLLKVLIFILIIIGNPLITHSQIYTFKNFKYEEGVSLISILSVEESDDGYIWFGTDGAGLMRYDGKSFDYLEEIQGRNNLHISDMDIAGGEIFFSSKYKGSYSIKNSKIQHLDFVKNQGDGLAIIVKGNRLILLGNNSLKIFEDSVLIKEKPIFPINYSMEYHGELSLENEHFIFSSGANYHVEGNEILELHEWLGVRKSDSINFVAAFKKNDSIVLIDKYLEYDLTVSLKGPQGKSAVKNVINKAHLNADERVIKSDQRGDIVVFLTNHGRVVEFNIKTSLYQIIENNTNHPIISPTDILIDRNEDIWITTIRNGIYRISIDPFTNLNSNELFESPYISFIGKSQRDEFIISTSLNSTYIGQDTLNDSFVEIKDLKISSMTHLGDKDLVSTQKGVYEVVDKKLVDYLPLAHLKGERVSLIFNAFGCLWYAIEARGLFKKDLQTGETESFLSVPAYFYNVVSPKDSSALYFGSNFGIQKYDKATGKLSIMPKVVNGHAMGTYVGNSVLDSHGTMWFSADNGLIGITKENKKVNITSEKILPSLLTYTLNSDQFGNIIVGSNKGITVIEVNAQGKALSSKTYNKENGFNGFETHMRSSFQSDDGTILVGTLNGLVLVRPEYFVRNTALNKPVIFSIKNQNLELEFRDSIELDSESNNLLIEFKSINTKSTYVTFSYKLIEGNEILENWSEWSPRQEAILNNLKSGSYKFVVKSSIDGTNVSEESTLHIIVNIPFYKNKWFIIGIIGFLVMIGISFLDNKGGYNLDVFLLSRDAITNTSTVKSLLIFGAVSNTLGHLSAARFDTSIENHDLSAIIVGVSLLILSLGLTYIKSAAKRRSTYLVLGFLILLGYNFIYTYLSGIHPFYFLVTIMITFVAPYSLKKTRSSVVLSIILGLTAVVISIFVEEVKFNQYLYLVGIGIACFLMVFNTFTRNNSHEKLMFTSGIVNNGNALVVAFDKKGEITFASENTEMLLGIGKSLKGENILILNNYQPSYNEMRRFNDADLISDFREGAIFLTPLISADDEVVYYQWSCKKFSEELRVILGQDVTEKINLENYYELIVRNADDLIFQMDTQGNFTFVNEKCCEVFERSKSELLDLSILNLVDPPFQKRVRYFIDATLHERQKGKYKEFPILTPSGETKWLGQNLSIMTMPGAENIVKGFLGLARDVTSKKKANSIIKEQNKSITDSINYARRIQFNMLPRSVDFSNSYNEHFILYKPKDIVSGDFFWLKEIENKTILILSDCTGHGVPGSFMTLLGISLLNQIIEEAKIIDPGQILNQMDERLSELLPRDGQNRIQDGMEMVVCSFDKDSNVVEYALAGGRFLIKDNRDESMKVVKGQIKHIGDETVKSDFAYITERISLEKDQILYLFSDGYPDQFGGKNNKKITIKRFLSLIDGISNQPLGEQNSILQEYFKAWMGDVDQTDDVTVIGVRGRK